MAITVPPVRGAGDLGHVDDSNIVRQALLDLESALNTDTGWRSQPVDAAEGLTSSRSDIRRIGSLVIYQAILVVSSGYSWTQDLFTLPAGFTADEQSAWLRFPAALESLSVAQSYTTSPSICLRGRNSLFLASSPTLTGTVHVQAEFGTADPWPTLTAANPPSTTSEAMLEYEESHAR